MQLQAISKQALAHAHLPAMLHFIKLFVHAALPWCYVMPPCRYLEENVGALAVQLTADELKELEAALPAHKVSGSRLR
jgi:hypothetical protein